MKERKIEKYFVKRVADTGGIQRKFVSPAHRAVPDRICGYAKGRFAFVEFKSTGTVPRPDQIREHLAWRKLGFEIAIIDSEEAVDIFVAQMSNDAN